MVIIEAFWTLKIKFLSDYLLKMKKSLERAQKRKRKRRNTVERQLISFDNEDPPPPTEAD